MTSCFKTFQVLFCTLFVESGKSRRYTEFILGKKRITFLQGWACISCHTGIECVCCKRNASTWVSRRADTHDAQLSGLGVDRKFTPTAQPRSPTSTSTNESTRQSKEGRNRHSVRINLALYNKYLYEKKKSFCFKFSWGNNVHQTTNSMFR